MPVRILLVDDHKIIRDCLRSLIENQPSMEIVGEAGNGLDAVTLAEALLPDIVLMDIAMPVMDGIKAAKEIVDLKRGIKVIGFSMHTDKRFVLRMMEVGASGYLLKDCTFEELSLAIHTVADGGTYLCSRTLNSRISAFPGTPLPHPGPSLRQNKKGG